MGRDASNKGAFQKPPKKSQAPIDNYRRRLGKYNTPNNTVGDDYPCLQTKPDLILKSDGVGGAREDST